MLIISLFGVTEFLILKAKKIGICEGYLYINVSLLMLFVSYICRYVPIKISNISEDINLFKLIGVLDINY